MRHKLIVAGLLAAVCMLADDSQRILTIDHYVRVRSTAPTLSGQDAQIYVREVVQARTVTRGGPAPDRVVLFVHGAGTPAEVAFDAAFQDYSWMAYLAAAGFDVFAMDMTGYGRSTRPAAMSDPCNLARAQQNAFIPQLISAPCNATSGSGLTTIASDWNDIDGVVNHLRALRRVDRLNLVGWSQGAPRAGGYTLQHPDKVLKLTLLAPAYNRTGPSDPPQRNPGERAVMNTQSHDEFLANWDRQTGCPDQYDKAATAAVWAKMLESDSVGATWGTGVRRAPVVPTWGWNQSSVAKLQVPILVIAGAEDKQVLPERVKELYTDVGSPAKVFATLACSSHNAIWERNHLLLFQASLDWLVRTSVKGVTAGMVKLGE